MRRRDTPRDYDAQRGAGRRPEMTTLSAAPGHVPTTLSTAAPAGVGVALGLQPEMRAVLGLEASECLCAQRGSGLRRETRLQGREELRKEHALKGRA